LVGVGKGEVGVQDRQFLTLVALAMRARRVRVHFMVLMGENEKKKAELTDARLCDVRDQGEIGPKNGFFGTFLDLLWNFLGLFCGDGGAVVVGVGCGRNYHGFGDVPRSSCNYYWKSCNLLRLFH
jgi:hypothetical protein